MKKRYIAIIVIIIVLIGIRLYLPRLVKNQINNQISAIEGYYGGVNRVSMQLFRGSVQMHDFVLFEEYSTDPDIPFIHARFTDLNIHWASLFKGHLVAEIYLDSLLVNFTLTEEEVDAEEERFDLFRTLEGLTPISINIFRITNSEISYIDPTSDPEVNIFLSDLFFEARNLRNIVNKQDTLPSTVRLETRIMETGILVSNAGLNLMKQVPDFEFDFELENVDLTQFNDFTDAYADFTIDVGILNLYSEAAARDGAVTGYVKPLIEILEITPPEKDQSLLQDIYEGVLDLFARLLKNPETENIGTRVEFEGRLDDPDVEVWSAIWTLLRNAFLESISKGIEGVVDIEDLN